jgi:glycerophosphoryl diester phosphodiesterase
MFRRNDPIFGIPTPILFAHRGGAKEVAESTELGFRHAIRCRSDVLEIDVQLTKDQEMVVWHGPGLENVRLAVADDLHGSRSRREIGEYDWPELRDQAWVADPGTRPADIKYVPQDLARRLLTLEQFLTMFPDVVLNIELKKCFTTAHLDRFIKVIHEHNPERVAIVASNRNEQLLQAFRTRTKERFATNLSMAPLIRCRIGAAFGLLRYRKLQNRALELPHNTLLSPERLIDQVREAGGTTYIFLTGFPLVQALDAAEGSPERRALFEILDRGVDGIMTDRPKRVRQLMDEWFLMKRA